MENNRTTGWKHKSTNKLSEKQQAKVGKVMHEFKEGELHSGSKKGPIVKDRDQAIAIALSEAKSMEKMSKGSSIKVGDVWEWHGVEYDPKKGDNYKVIKQVEILDIDSKGQVKGRYVGTTKNFIVREPNKYLKKKVTDKIKRGAVLTPLDVKDGDIFKTIDGDTIQVSIINSDKDGKYYILRHHPLNNSKPENKLLPFEFDRYYKAGLYEKVDPSSLIKNENKMVRGGYTNPGYDVKTTGVYLFKTKNGSFNVISYLFERENDTEDSLEIQDDLRDKLGSILIQNSSWKRLSSGKPVKAKSAYGDYVGTLTRIDDTKNVSKYTSGTYNDYQFSEGGTIEVGDKVKASKEYGGKSGRVIDKMGSFVVVEYSNGQSDSYHESDLIKKMETGGGFELTKEDYKKMISQYEDELNKRTKQYIRYSESGEIEKANIAKYLGDIASKNAIMARQKLSNLLKKMKDGGELEKMSLTKLLDKVPIFEQMHIEGYSEYTRAKMAYDDFNNEIGNKHLSFEEKTIYDNFSQRRLKALSKYKENVIKYLQSNKVNKKMSGGKLTALIEDIKEFDKNIYPKNSDVSYKNRLIIAKFKTKGYSIIEISKALKVIRNS